MYVPSSELEPPTPVPGSDCAPPSGTKGGGEKLACGCEVVGGVPIRTTGEKA
jgi:hypothetical protein